jgi:hypothetical protein
MQSEQVCVWGPVVWGGGGGGEVVGTRMRLDCPRKTVWTLCVLKIT